MFSINDNAKGFLRFVRTPIIVLVIFTLLMSSTVLAFTAVSYTHLGGKFLLLKILPHEGFYHPDICDVFLNGGVKTVYLGLHFCKTGESHFCYDKYCRKKNRHTHKEYHGPVSYTHLDVYKRQV